MERVRAKNVWVVPYGTQWGVRLEDEQTLLRIFSTKDAAIEYGRDLAKRTRVELVVLGRDGKIQWRNSYGNDPFPPRG